jgi:DNA-binding MarR family transcriptional regulator/GNAT superfamily N-acetyltransferase
MASKETAVAAVRRFNRFYTAAIGTLDEGLLNSSFSLAEARLLFEIATSGAPVPSALAARLRLDPGYVSRILARFTARGLIRRRTSPADARQSIISLTAAGRREFALLNRRSDEQVSALLAPLRPPARRQLLDAMHSIGSLLGNEPAPPPGPIVLRVPRPGDIGWIIHRHGALYAQEYGWDERMEALVARIAADFIDHFDPKRERCWIAECDGEFLGCVFLVKDRDARKNTPPAAKLRLLLVEPSARGLGIGRTLVRQCTLFAREAGYARIVLWTNSVLTSARRIYESEGYRLVKQEDHESFGKKLTGQHWELRL